MLMRFFISINLIGCGGDINQSDSYKQCMRKACKARNARKARKVRKARMACKVHKARKVVRKISGFYVNEVFQFPLI